jgi:hypothetical protein
MLNTANLSSFPFTRAAYHAAHRADVRALAEMVGDLHSGGDTLADPEDSRFAVFNECVSLYAAKHNISESELADALAIGRALNLLQ